MRHLILILTMGLAMNLQAQTTLDEYIQTGLENNLALQQNNMSLREAEQALKVAKGMFLPRAGIEARYSLADGGRTIEFPIGDLLNPVYSTLNDMMQDQGQEGQFPMLENQQINFMRQQEYNATLTVVQPLYSRSLYLNRQISQQQLNMSQLELEKFKRELAFQIKEAYYNYLQAYQFTQLIARTKDVVLENYRVTQKLVESDLATRDAVLRAKSDVSQVELFETSVRKQHEMAKSFFNFMLNRDLQTTIVMDDEQLIALDNQLAVYTQNALNRRQELNQLDAQTEIYKLLADANRAENLPTLMLAVDAGLQGEKLNDFGNSDYMMGSVVLSWTLFNGNINKNKRQQALIQRERSQLQKQETIQQITLEVKNDFLAVQELSKNMELATDRNAAAREVYRIVEKRYRQGEAALVELLDARNNMVEAETDMIATKYKLLTSVAKLEKSSASVITQ